MLIDKVMAALARALFRLKHVTTISLCNMAQTVANDEELNDFIDAYG
jgi:hypothetical protein